MFNYTETYTDREDVDIVEPEEDTSIEDARAFDEGLQEEARRYVEHYNEVMAELREDRYRMQHHREMDEIFYGLDE